jgi:hypothetical protein
MEFLLKLIITPASQIGKNDLVFKAHNHWARTDLQKLQRPNLSSKVLLQKLSKQAHFLVERCRRYG